MRITVLYRGPLERSRLSFLCESAARAFGACALVWISPRRMNKQMVEHFQAFVAMNPWIEDYEFVDGRLAAAPAIIRHLRRVLEHREDLMMAVGFTSAFYAQGIAKGKWVWCVNGIPEEEQMHAGSLKRRILAKAMWRAISFFCSPDLAVTVSRPMADLIRNRCRFPRATDAPNCVDLNIFKPRGSVQRKYMTYLGTGAPWQGIDRLSEVWAAMYRQDNRLRFRVISRDERTKALGAALPDGAVEYRAVEDPNDVARLLWEAEAGFFLREKNIVNRVSFPTKFGEYVAAGAFVTSTDIDWDPGEIIKKTGCGVLVRPDERPDGVARAVMDFRRRSDIRERVRAAADMLDREIWVNRLSHELKAASHEAERSVR